MCHGPMKQADTKSVTDGRTDKWSSEVMPVCQPAHTGDTENGSSLSAFNLVTWSYNTFELLHFIQNTTALLIIDCSQNCKVTPLDKVEHQPTPTLHVFDCPHVGPSVRVGLTVLCSPCLLHLSWQGKAVHRHVVKKPTKRDQQFIPSTSMCFRWVVWSICFIVSDL